jgi:NAD+ synthase
MGTTTLQQEIIQALHTRPSVDPAGEVRHRVAFLKDYLLHSCMTALVLGISGGQDSSLTGRICQMAVEELRSGNGGDYLFVALRLPYGVQKDEEDAQRALQFIQPDRVYTVDVKPAVDAAVASYTAATGLTMTDYNKGNQKAQARMAVQYRFAHHFHALVVGTDHAAEALTGFFTKYGDGGTDINPLTGLNKRQGRQLLQHLGADPAIYLKAPTADLLDQVPGQLDETELGITYEDIDAYLEGHTIDPQIAEKIEHRYLITQHKRTLPVTPFDTWWR